MRKLGIPPENLQPDRYSGPRFSLVPCVEAKRRPLTLDRDYSLLTLWRVDFSPTSGDEGEVWQLVRFESNGDATWRRVDFSNAGPGIDSITVDSITAPGVSPVEPDGIGDIDFLGNVVANHTVPIETHSRGLNAFNVEIQVSTARTGAPANMLDAGVCSFDDTAFVVDANGYVTLAGGLGPAIDSIDIDFNTIPGTDPVVPDGAGMTAILGNTVVNGTNANSPVATHSRAANQLHLDVQLAAARTGAPGDPFDVGLCSFDDTSFAVDANGYVTLAGGAGPSVDQINVDSNTGPGTDPVVASGTGEISVAGAAVAAHSVPIETHSRAVNAYNIEAQVATTVSGAPGAKTDTGLSVYETFDFTVDTDGYVSRNLATRSIVGVENLGITYSAPTFTVTSADGTALSASNPAFVTLQSKTSPGLLVTVKVTADQTFTDGSTGSIDNARFGVTTAVDWLTDCPFFIYAVVNDSEDTIAFMISRNPAANTSPAVTSISQSGSIINVDHLDFYSLPAITLADYNNNPCLPIGSFRMQFTGATDSWATETFNARDGIGEFMENAVFDFPTGQNGASSGSFFLPNGGTAPVFTTSNFRYTVDRQGLVGHYIDLNGDGGTDGSGAVNALLAVPLPLKSSTQLVRLPVGQLFNQSYPAAPCFFNTSNGTNLILLESDSSNSLLGDFSAGHRTLGASFQYIGEF